MKKSVVILIAIIYVSAIALVSFFGLQYKVFEAEVPVESITILNDGLKYNAEWGNYVVIRPDANGDLRYQIQYRVGPDNATNQKVGFSYDTQNTNVSIDEHGLVTFQQGGDMVKVQLIPMDGSDVSATITIIAQSK